MSVPGFIFLVSLAGTALAIAIPGQMDFILLAGPAAIAGFWLLIGEWRRSGRGKPGGPDTRPWMILDGSNVMYWHENTPKLHSVYRVISHLSEQGFRTKVVFDANAGYLIDQRYINDRDFARLLGLRAAQVVVVDKGTPADPYILAVARRLRGRVVTNDKYRDWAGDHPEVDADGHLIRGGFRNDKLWLDLKDAATAQVA